MDRVLTARTCVLRGSACTEHSSGAHSTCNVARGMSVGELTHVVPGDKQRSAWHASGADARFRGRTPVSSKVSRSAVLPGPRVPTCSNTSTKSTTQVRPKSPVSWLEREFQIHRELPANDVLIRSSVFSAQSSADDGDILRNRQPVLHPALKPRGGDQCHAWSFIPTQAERRPRR